MSDPTVPPVEPAKKPAAKAPAKAAAKAPVKPAKPAVAAATGTPETVVKAPAKPRTKAVPAAEVAPVVASETPAAAKRRVPVKLLVAILVPVVVLAALGGLAAANRQFLTDQWTVWNFEATPAIASYIDDSTMTDHALFLFNASKPRVAADSEFNDVCGSHEGNDGVLGCYTPKNKRIILFEISDKRLAGFQEAVAAHEMLHAAWDRLGDGERERLAVLLDAEVERLDGDKEFQDQLDAYHFGKNDDAERSDELHSLIATEVTGVSDELEVYYEQYFTDRHALVGQYEKAHLVLVRIAEQVTALNDELDALDKKIEDDYKAYTDGYDTLNADWDAFGARNDAYFYKSQAAFDRDRNALIARGDALDALFDSIDAMTDEYNQKIEELNDLDAKAAELYGAINLDPESAITS
jgi:hypothetical protein